MKTKTLLATSCTLLLFINSCTKTKTSNIGGEPITPIVFQFILIDKDSNAIYKYPDVLSTNYNPKNLLIIDQGGDTMKPYYISNNHAESLSDVFNLDKLKNGSEFYTEFVDSRVNSVSANTYYFYYNNTDIDTLTVDTFSKVGYKILDYKYNKNSLPQYKGNKNSLFLSAAYLIIK